MNLIPKLTIKITESFDRIARTIFLIIVALVVGNVIFRFFGRPFGGCYEWVGFLMASAISLALSYCAAQEGHVAVTILVERLSKKNQMKVDIIVNILILLFLLMTVRMLILYGNRMFAGGYIGMTTKVPMHYFAYIIALGFVGYSLVLYGNLVESIKKVSRK
ncbi:MAG: TRAP transporter small permease [Bacillota bacterium]|nr:TRAP transporter small permease [Bacillota bacterium]